MWYLVGTGAYDKVKSSVFLNIVGKETLALYNTFIFTESQTMLLSVILSQFEEKCVQKKDETLEQQIFFFLFANKQQEKVYIIMLQN